MRAAAGERGAGAGVCDSLCVARRERENNQTNSRLLDKHVATIGYLSNHLIVPILTASNCCKEARLIEAIMLRYSTNVYNSIHVKQ